MKIADSIDQMREEFKSEHLAQASGAGYSIELGIVFTEAERHLARIAHNIKSVVETIPHGDTIEDVLEEAYNRR